MATTANWQTSDHLSTWERIKEAFRNDWEQTRSDFGSDRARDLDQDVDDTVKQMLGKESPVNYQTMKFEDQEPAFRYGHSASMHYGKTHQGWNPTLRDELRRDYDGNWERDEPMIRYAYLYGRRL